MSVYCRNPRTIDADDECPSVRIRHLNSCLHYHEITAIKTSKAKHKERKNTNNEIRLDITVVLSSQLPSNATKIN
jgi:hypothetical protein